MYRLLLVVAFFLATNLYAQRNQKYYKFQLGRLLFFDKILSGNKNISCATCHHPQMGSSDALALGVGEGGNGLGLKRNLGKGKHAVHERIPRNSPAIFNLGHKFVRVMFHDGRLKFNKKYPSGIDSPAKYDLPEGLDSLASAQALFPVQSAAEMAGQKGENRVADAVARGDLAGENGVWNLLAKRLRKIPQYIEYFKKAYPNTVSEASDIDYVKAANAIGFFERNAFKSMKSKYDFHRKNSKKFKLTKRQDIGEKLFYGKGRCSQCHSGPLFTDNKFYSLAIPPIGMGKGDGHKGLDDFGLEKETGKRKDRYKFKTPSLRNVTRTAPYGHNGAYTSLKQMIRHHLNPAKRLLAYNPKKQKIRLPYRKDLAKTDFALLKNRSVIREIAESSDIDEIRISENEVDSIIEFLKTLEEKNFDKKYSDFIPKAVPSGLPIDK